jgi:hypothetical protein
MDTSYVQIDRRSSLSRLSKAWTADDILHPNPTPPSPPRSTASVLRFRQGDHSDRETLEESLQVRANGIPIHRGRWNAIKMKPIENLIQYGYDVFHCIEQTPVVTFR